MFLMHVVIGLLGVGLSLVAAGYEAMALLAVVVWKLRGAGRPTSPPSYPVTLLKPLCGAEPGLYENLRSFCLQDYPQYQIVFGVQDAADPALEVVGRLIREYPALSINVVVNAKQHGSNRKISSLINMVPHAEHDVLMIADSDALVGPDYLSTVVAPLTDPGVGLVTCVYRSVPTSKVWSRLGAMYVNDWYMPSVLLAWLFGHRGYASGLTLCLRRDTLQAIGGLRRLSNHLADDYELGALVRAVGLRIALSTYLPRTEHAEQTLEHLVRHETRWMRTIRVLRPKSFRFLFLSFCLPLAFLGIALSEELPAASSISMALFLTTVCARLALFIIPKLNGGKLSFTDLWLLPARDLLLWWVWLRALRSSRVTWRGNEFAVDAQGIMRSVS
jgi:ceramide glucosyltransferase